MKYEYIYLHAFESGSELRAGECPMVCVRGPRALHFAASAR